MSYTAPALLTLLLLCTAAAPVFAQSDTMRRELDELASPYAIDRVSAIHRIAALEGDIAADLRVAYRFAETPERLGLLEAARIRADAALVQHAAEAVNHDDDRLQEHARDYLLSLPFAVLVADNSEWDDAAKTAWDDFVLFRVRRDIVRALLLAHLMPGKYYGQFEGLAAFDSDLLHRELIRMLTADAGFAAPMNRASTELLTLRIPTSRSLATNWRRLHQTAGAYEPVFAYLRNMYATAEVEQGVRKHSRSVYLAAHEVVSGVRQAAVRALVETSEKSSLAGELAAYYHVLRVQMPEREVVNVLGTDALMLELEVMLARCGDDVLLQARIATLRAQIQRDQAQQANVNMRPTARTDLMATNEIAHLLLRAGDAASAELEWQAAADAALALARETDARNRASLASYLAAVYYNLACTQSLQAKLTRSMASLKKAVEYGYRDFSWMLDDGDLMQVRQLDAFRAWFENTAPPSVVDRLVRD